MKTWQETVTRREGENMGSIDTNFNFDEDECLYPNNPERRKEKFDLLIKIEKLFREGKKLRITYNGQFSGKLVDVGMYDGWPFWKPTPAVMLNHWHGNEWHFWYDINSYKILVEKLEEVK